MQRWILTIATLSLASCGMLPGTAAHDVSKAQTAVSANLRDPSSAQFRNDRVIAAGSDRFVCGEVNGRNGAGAYDGFVPYVYAVTSGKVQLLGPLSEPSTPRLRQACVSAYVDMAAKSDS